MKSVQPNWSGEARFPRTIRIDVWASNNAWGPGNGQREIVIKDKSQELPSAIVLFLKNHPQYRTWFLSEQPKTLPAEQPEDKPVEVMPVAVEVEAVEEDEPDKPKRGRRKKAAADGDE